GKHRIRLATNLVRKRALRQMGATPFQQWLQFVHNVANVQRFLKTSAGLRPSAAKVPSNPSASVTASAASAAAPARPASQTNGKSMTRLTMRPAAIEPIATPQ